MFNFNKSVEIALRTWYPESDGLHLNHYHPLGKLIGEWGELMEDQMKIQYKPNYEPETEKELGDIWYYIRILCYQINHVPQVPGAIADARAKDMISKSINYMISYAIEKCSQAFQQLEDHGYFWSFPLDLSYSILIEICKRNNITVQQLTDSNWEKLKPGSERGEQWMSTRVDLICLFILALSMLNG